MNNIAPQHHTIPSQSTVPVEPPSYKTARKDICFQISLNTKGVPQATTIDLNNQHLMVLVHKNHTSSVAETRAPAKEWRNSSSPLPITARTIANTTTTLANTNLQQEKRRKKKKTKKRKQRRRIQEKERGN